MPVTKKRKYDSADSDKLSTDLAFIKNGIAIWNVNIMRMQLAAYRPRFLSALCAGDFSN